MKFEFDKVPCLSKDEAEKVDNLTLAYLGDAVTELMARCLTFSQSGGSNGDLHRKTVGYVSANAQSAALAKILPLLTEEETAVYKRGRNVKTHSSPKHTDPTVYHRATGLEALFGYLFITGQNERINELFSVGFEENDGSEVK